MRILGGTWAMLCLDHCEKEEGISPRDFGGLFALVLTYISSLLPLKGL